MTLVLYLYKKFLPVFLGALAFFSLLLVLIDLLMNMWLYISEQVPPIQIFNIMLLYIPKTLWYAAPLAVLFAVSFTLSGLYANNELTVIFASGVSLIKFTMPLLLFSLVMSFGFFYFEDNIVVPLYKQKVDLQKVVLKQEKSKNNDRVVVLSESGDIVYKADYYDDTNQRLYSLYVVVRNHDNTLNRIIYANSARFDGTKWVLSNKSEYKMVDDNLVLIQDSTSDDEDLTELPESFRNFEISVEEVNSKDAQVYINQLRRTGLPSAEAKSVYYKKFAFPAIIFIVVFLSIGLSGKSRKNVLLISLVLCVSAAVSFYVLQMVTMLLAKFEYISPFVGAWFPVFFFVTLSVLLIKFART